jgi:hypothetical protein
VLSEYSASFAEHLLPFNFAVGIGGRCDIIIKTLQLAVDKYITEKENDKDLPSRCLVSLDIRNMFNAVSRELRNFPLLNHLQMSFMKNLEKLL